MTAVERPVDVRPGRIGRDTWVMTRRNLLRYVRLPQLLAFSVIQPIMFLLLFTYVFGGAIGSEIPPAAGGEYINFLLPGLLVQISMFGATQTAVGLTDDLSRGVVDRFRSLPMTRSAVLTGRTAADLLRNAVVLGLMFVVAFVIGFRYQTTFLGFLAGVGVVLLFAYAVSWVMAAIGLKVVNPEATQTAVFLIVFPFVFASAVFVPVSTMPDWLQPFAEHQPVTVMVEAARGLMLGQGALPPGRSVAQAVLLAVGWCAVITAVAAPLAVRIYRRTAKR
ncbi:MAG: ABC transporter permease [Acidimicrobiales bacterium]|nr:ABC transporter permease [Acidimicrobiales bacterium]